MKKTIFILISSLFILASCSKKNAEEQEKSIRIDNVPEYVVDEVDLPDKVSRLNYIRYDSEKIYVSASFEDEPVKIIEKTIDDQEIITEFDINSDIFNGNGMFANHSYYERGIQYNELCVNNSEVEVKSAGSNDAKNHQWICGMCYSDYDETVLYLTNDIERNYYIFKCDSDNFIKDKNGIPIPDDYIASGLTFCNNRYYISAYRVDMIDGKKSYPSSILIYDNNYNFIEEIIDINIEQISGCIDLDDNCYAVYSLDEANNATYLEIVDGDMATTSEVSKFTGESRFFPSEAKNTVYIADDKSIVLFNPVLNKNELRIEIEPINNEIYRMLYCDGSSYAYAIKNNTSETSDFEIDDQFEFYKADCCTNFDYYFNSDDKYVVRDKSSDTEIDIDYDGIIPLTFYGDSFWGINAAGKIVIYDFNGALKETSLKDNYVTEALLLGNMPSAICRNNEDYIFCMLNSEDGCVKEESIVKEQQYIMRAEAYYPGDNMYEFYVLIDGYILGYETDKKMFEPLVDLTKVKNDTAILSIRYISDGVFQLISENKVYRLMKKSGEKNTKKEIIIGNLSYENLYSLIDSDEYNDYSFKIVNYREDNTGEVNFSKLNQDVMNGCSPDIIVRSSDTDVTYLERMNFFMRIEKNEIFEQNKEWLENIISAFNSKDDDVYYIPNGFKIYTLVSSHNDIDVNWNYKVFLEMIKNKTLKEDKYTLLDFCMFPYSLSHINSFGSELGGNSNIFKEEVSVIKEYALTSDEAETMYELLHGEMIGTDYDCQEDEEIYHICGYPSADSGNSYIHSDIVYSVSRKSEFKDECLEFIKEKVLESYGHSFSIEKDKYVNQINQMSSYNNIEFMHLLDDTIASVTTTDRIDSTISSIIEDGVFDFFENDNSSADEELKKIENKIMLYINETE